MLTIQELKKEADNLFKKDNFKTASDIYLQIWEIEQTELNGKLLAKCYRKAEKFKEAYELHETLKLSFPSSGGIKLDKLWLDYTYKIKDWQNPNLLSDALELLNQTDRNNKYTGSIYNKTVLKVLSKLTSEEDNSIFFDWLQKIDFSLLETESYQNYPSDYKRYFVYLADTLVNSDKQFEEIEKCLTELKFDGLKHTEFKKHIFEQIKYTDYNGREQISRLSLALFLRVFKEEILARQNNLFTNIYNPNQFILVSNLSDFVFCPVSYAIKQTLSIKEVESWNNDEWLGDKKYLYHRYRTFQNSQKYDIAFSDTYIKMTEKTIKEFGNIFNSNLIIENFKSNNVNSYTNSNNTVKGIPDYVFQTSEGKRFVVSEKFTKQAPSDYGQAFQNDIAKIYAYVKELEILNIDYGLILYWYGTIEEVQTENLQIKKKVVVTDYKLFRVDKSEKNDKDLTNYLETIKKFKNTKKMVVDGMRISHPKKCLSCSVVSYCNHKTGKFDLVKLPYDIYELESNSDSKDDLPF